MSNTSDEPKKILVLQQRQLGDVVVTTPVFAAIKKRFPHAHLSLFTEEKCLPLVKHDPHIDAFEILEKSANTPWWKQWQRYFQIRQNKYDCLVDLQQLPRCQLATLFSGAKQKISFTPRHGYRKFLYSHYQVPENFEKYISDGKIDIMSSLFHPLKENEVLEDFYSRPKLYLLEEEKQEARQILDLLGIQQDDTFLTLDATHKHSHRRWSKYLQLVQKILDNYPSMKIFLLRAPGEEDQLKDFLLLNPTRVFMPESAPSLRLSMAIMSYASFHIGNTSAPAHMALALNIPSLIILSHTAQMWHYAPIKPHKGEAKQLEVRVKDELLQDYYQKTSQSIQEEHKAKKKRPELFLINEEQAFNAFKQLYEDAYY